MSFLGTNPAKNATRLVTLVSFMHLLEASFAHHTIWWLDDMENCKGLSWENQKRNGFTRLVTCYFHFWMGLPECLFCEEDLFFKLFSTRGCLSSNNSLQPLARPYKNIHQEIPGLPRFSTCLCTGVIRLPPLFFGWDQTVQMYWSFWGISLTIVIAYCLGW